MTDTTHRGVVVLSPTLTTNPVETGSSLGVAAAPMPTITDDARSEFAKLAQRERTMAASHGRLVLENPQVADYRNAQVKHTTRAELYTALASGIHVLCDTRTQRVVSVEEIEALLCNCIWDEDARPALNRWLSPAPHTTEKP